MNEYECGGDGGEIWKWCSAAYPLWQRVNHSVGRHQHPLQAFIARLVNSMRRRCRTCLDSNGGHTHHRRLDGHLVFLLFWKLGATLFGMENVLVLITDLTWNLWISFFDCWFKCMPNMKWMGSSVLAQCECKTVVLNWIFVEMYNYAVWRIVFENTKRLVFLIS